LGLENSESSECNDQNLGRIQEFLKGGPVRGAKPQTERRRRERRRGASPENFEKLDAISCNLAYIFGIRMASDIIQNWAFAERKTVVATISIHTHTHTPYTLPKTPWISATIKSKFNFKHIFSDIVYNVENKIDFAKNRGGPVFAPENRQIELLNSPQLCANKCSYRHDSYG